MNKLRYLFLGIILLLYKPLAATTNDFPRLTNDYHQSSDDDKNFELVLNKVAEPKNILYLIVLAGICRWIFLEMQYPKTKLNLVTLLAEMKMTQDSNKCILESLNKIPAKVLCDTINQEISDNKDLLETYLEKLILACRTKDFRAKICEEKAGLNQKLLGWLKENSSKIAEFNNDELTKDELTKLVESLHKKITG